MGGRQLKTIVFNVSHFDSTVLSMEYTEGYKILSVTQVLFSEGGATVVMLGDAITWPVLYVVVVYGD
eukprot:m.1651140 g.1651140  ORF g.1651140 m.1651140 type:complete len:67 (+) comp89440_c0_seq1:122-322(+)